MQTAPLPPLDDDGLMLPTAWRSRLADAHVEACAIGMSRADVFRVRGREGPDRFLKAEQIDAVSELHYEIARLRWLHAQGVPVPEVLDAVEENGRRWLLMTALPGADLAASSALAPAQVVVLMADALKQLHALPVSGCPFDHRVSRRLAAAKARLAAGQVDAEDFDDEQQGQSADQVFVELLATVPALPQADLVITHGDACLPNLIAEDGRFSGFIDCGRAGVADRHQDLALAARSIADDLGQAWVQPFFAHYGVAPDPQRLAFYRLLDEFF